MLDSLGCISILQPHLELKGIEYPDYCYSKFLAPFPPAFRVPKT